MPSRCPWRSRDAEWARLAACLVVLCLLFSLWPELDLLVSARFAPVPGATAWWGNDQAWVRAVYWSVPWLGRLAALACLVACLWAWWRPQALARHWRRRAALLVLLMLLGVGAAVNGGFKEHWGRARPMSVLVFGGDQPFTPALRPTAGCEHNCSFVSGHAATGFALVAVGLLGGPKARRHWWRVGLVAGLGIGLTRIAQGGHFFSDVLFAGWLMWATALLVRQLWLVQRVRRVRARRRAPPAALHAA